MSILADLVKKVEAVPAELVSAVEAELKKAHDAIHNLLSGVHADEGALQHNAEDVVKNTTAQAKVDVEAATHNVNDVAGEVANKVDAAVTPDAQA